MTTISAFSAAPLSSAIPSCREARDPVGDDLDLAPADRLEEIGVGDEAEALVPRIVAGAEMAIDVIARRQIGNGELAQGGAHPVRLGAGAVEEEDGQQDVLPARRPGPIFAASRSRDGRETT